MACLWQIEPKQGTAVRSWTELSTFNVDNSALAVSPSARNEGPEKRGCSDEQEQTEGSCQSRI